MNSKEYLHNYYLKNKERLLVKNKQYYENNKKRILEICGNYTKNYRKTKMGRAVLLCYDYKRHDKEHNRGEGNLTAQWIVDNIFTQPCAHCGETDWTKLGCNRLDNSKPHTTENVEPCCKKCNDFLANPPKQVYQYTLEGELIRIWESTAECGKNNFNRGAVAACCRNEYWHSKGKNIYKGYKWSYIPL